MTYEQAELAGMVIYIAPVGWRELQVAKPILDLSIVKNLIAGVDRNAVASMTKTTAKMLVKNKNKSDIGGRRKWLQTPSRVFASADLPAVKVSNASLSGFPLEDRQVVISVGGKDVALMDV